MEETIYISGAFVTGDNVGYVTAWDAKSRRRLFELPGCANSIASLTYNNEGQILAVASSHTYQEATEISPAESAKSICFLHPEPDSLLS
ncbi:Mitotic checkpoint bub3 [Gossypium arboreum]|uniref:Mitotic checkpoint bub3 n=1 Tax=Gossypium arboreum TaxID=29729 RepID=A0A0B0P5Q0_GOSAR|nr:Mitotic checkpoint bub3 [Gossypium arboreum]